MEPDQDSTRDDGYCPYCRRGDLHHDIMLSLARQTAERWEQDRLGGYYIYDSEDESDDGSIFSSPYLD